MSAGRYQVQALGVLVEEHHLAQLLALRRQDAASDAGLPGIARRVTGCNLPQETRVQHALGAVVGNGPGRCYSPRQRMSFHSRTEGSNACR